MPYPNYFNNYIVKVIGPARLYVCPPLFSPLFFLSPQVLRVGLVLVELDLDLSLSFGSAWIAESKVQLISFMATYVGVMHFTLCTQKTICQDGY